VLLRKQPVAASVNRGGHAAGKILDFSETQLWR
jgi:hypothetical protein